MSTEKKTEVQILRDALEKLKELHRFTDSLFHYDTRDWKPYEKEPNGIRKLLKEVEAAIIKADEVKDEPINESEALKRYRRLLEFCSKHNLDYNIDEPN